MQLHPEASEWFAFRVRSRHEKLVSSSLRGKGYTEFLPLSRSNRKWSDRSVTLELPLFPGYIFCDIALCEIGRVRATTGIVDVVRAGSAPAPARRSEVESLLQASEAGLALEDCLYAGPAAGSRVRIDRGPLAGHEGVVAEHRGRRRLVLSLDLLQRSVLVELDPGAVSLCPDLGFAPVPVQSRAFARPGAAF